MQYSKKPFIKLLKKLPSQLNKYIWICCNASAYIMSLCNLPYTAHAQRHMKKEQKVYTDWSRSVVCCVFVCFQYAPLVRSLVLDFLIATAVSQGR